MNDHSTRWAETVHAMVWICDIDHPEPEPFRSREAAEKHMRQEHNDKFSDAQISAIAKRSFVHRSRSFGVCPICNFDIQKDDRATTRGFFEDINDEDISHLYSEQSSSNLESKGKRVRFDTSQPPTPPELALDIDFAGINDFGLFWHKPSEAELRNQIAKHVAEHLQSLSFFALRLLLLDERQIDSAASEDGMESDKILSNSTNTEADSRSELPEVYTVVDSETPLPDVSYEWYAIATFGASCSDHQFLIEEEYLQMISREKLPSISTANATIGQSIDEVRFTRFSFLCFSVVFPTVDNHFLRIHFGR